MIRLSLLGGGSSGRCSSGRNVRRIAPTAALSELFIARSVATREVLNQCVHRPSDDANVLGAKQQVPALQGGTADQNLAPGWQTHTQLVAARNLESCHQRGAVAERQFESAMCGRRRFGSFRLLGLHVAVTLGAQNGLDRLFARNAYVDDALDLKHALGARVL